MLGCSAIVNPDPSDFPGGPDGGVIPDATPDGTVPDVNMPDRVEVPDVVVPPPMCEFQGSQCEGDSLVTCTAGVETREPCPLGCVDDACAPFVPSNVSGDLFDLEARSLNLADPEAFLDTTECQGLEAESSVENQGNNGPDVCVLQVRDLRIGDGATLRVTGERGLVILASGSVELRGTIDVSAYGAEPGPGGFQGSPLTNRPDGFGPLAGGRGQNRFFEDGGGGGGGF
ncbi:MAG: hypothetical protein AAGF12_18815, partial [Myxococcota bacterium]